MLFTYDSDPNRMLVPKDQNRRMALRIYVNRGLLQEL